MAYKNETIKNAVLKISNNQYLLPAIQREMVWNHYQIIKLFDSILSGYPFGSMLFWDYDNSKTGKEYKFYEFLKKYDESNQNSNHNIEHDTKGKTVITGILDGQQRLTALYLGLKGSLNLHIPRKKWNKAHNFENKKLYINLLYSKDQEIHDEDISPDFELRFLTEEEAAINSSNIEYYWFEIGKSLEWEETKDSSNMIKDFGLDNYSEIKFTDEQISLIENVYNKIYENLIAEPRISYFEEKTQSLDKILNIFVRINSGGTILDYTDFLMSMIINQWGNGREKVHETLDVISKDFNFDIPKDIFLRACLFLSDENLNFKADSFKQNTIKNIKDNFDIISNSIKISCKTFQKLGYSKHNLRSNLILLPLAYYIKANGLTEIKQDIEKVNRWIQRSILSRVFGSQTTSYLTKLRKEVNWKGSFPQGEIISVSNQANKNMKIDAERIEDIIDKAKKGSQDCWAILTLLYPSLKFDEVSFHEDHIFPYSTLNQADKKIGDLIANIQFLEGRQNCSKSNKSPNIWIKEFCQNDENKMEDYKIRNYIPLNIDLSQDNFHEFITHRKKLIKEKILEILVEKNSDFEPIAS